MKDFSPKAWFLPQPVAIIGTYDADGNANAMNAAWAGTWDGTEIVVSLSHHATTDNLDVTGEFTVTFGTVDTVTSCDFVGLVSAKKDPDKLKKTGWTVEPSKHVNAPVFSNFPITLECRVKEKLQESATGFYLVGEIVNIVAREDCLAADGKPDVEAMRLITFDPIHNGYVALGSRVGDAFKAGLALK